MYKSPITIYDFSDIATQTEKMRKALQDEFEDYIMTEVTKTLGVEVDKEELVKALRYDRDQYEAGFREGHQARDKEIVRCEDCKYWVTAEERLIAPYCEKIGIKGVNGYRDFDDFCSYGERRETECK